MSSASRGVVDSHGATDGDTGENAHDVVSLLQPHDGTPTPITTGAELRSLAASLGAGAGPIALDTERASGFRYGDRAFLIQLRRANVGTVLVDPVPFDDLTPLASALGSSEWVLHAATQDLPCLAELGLAPRQLFDTELAGRLAGLPRVGLAPLTEQVLSVHLAKGHGADDWSRRPLPSSWLDYAALDVELLVELRDELERLLDAQGKLEFARQEFAAIVAAPPPAPREDPWRRTSGIHKISDRQTLAAIRELWWTRDRLARDRDIAPHRVLPDRAIVTAATEMPASVAELASLPTYSGHRQRRQATRWFSALEAARALPESELPPRRLPTHGPPPPGRWARKEPAAAARLTAARATLEELSEQWSIPVENLARPSLVREVLWHPPAPADIPAALTAGGARPWQVELVAPLLVAALDARD